MADTPSTSSNSTTTSTLSDWAGPYVTDMLGKAQAYSSQPYAMYDAPLTAGPSSVQQQAFQGVGSLMNLPSNTTNFTPTTFSSGLPGTSASNPYGVGSITDYMNPFMQNAIMPQLTELRRQADIGRMNDAARLTNAGAYGGSRQAILEAEGERNLGQLQSDVLGKGYASAYDRAQDMQLKTAQLGMDAQKNSEQSRQFGANLGLDQGKYGIAAIDEMLKAGGQQRDIEQQGLTADYNEFTKQRDYPMQMLQFQRDMISGLPMSTVTNTPNGVSGFQNAVGTATGLASLYQALKNLGIG